jgi:hypothetical protein
MNSDAPTPSDRLQDALGASCAALLALEHARNAMSGGAPELERSIEAELQAIELVRSAISDLRRITRTSTPSALAYGFVQPGEEGEPEPIESTL